MALFSMRCPGCGLIQSRSPTCKACGAAIDEANPGMKSGASDLTPQAARRQPARAESRWPAASPEPSHGERRRLFFHGNGGSLFGIHIVNIFFTIITLGIYSFWGRVRVRSYLLSQTEFEGDRFAYHGTGKELLIGFIKATIVFGIPFAALNNVPMLLGAGIAVTIGAAIAAYLILIVFIPFAMVSARRYRLSRSSWRGVRFSFRGRIKDFIKLFVTNSILTTITLGLYYPIFETKRYAFMISHSYFGNEKFTFDGNPRGLFWSFALALLLLPLTFGLSWFWFLAKKERYFWDHTSLGAARFRATVTGGRLLLLKLGNFFLLVSTLGLAWPWVLVRKARFVFGYLSLEGPLDMTVIQQEAQAATATGEGLASFLDLDAGFDLG